MAGGVRTRIKLLDTAAAGEIITIKTQVTHLMETGHRLDSAGLPMPRSIIHRLHCTFDGETVVDVDLRPGISTNPFFEFDALVTRSGLFEFAWYDDDGSVYTASEAVTVT